MMLETANSNLWSDGDAPSYFEKAPSKRAGLLARFFRWIALGAAGFFLMVGMGVFAFGMHAWLLEGRGDRELPSLSMADYALESVPPLARAAAPSVPPRRAMETGCDGQETLCATATTDDPGETLQKWGAAWRQGEAKPYRVRVTVMAADP